MLKQRKIKIRILLIFGVTIIFASSITPLIMMAVDNVRSLGSFAMHVGGQSIKRGSTLLFLEKVKAKASVYSEAFSQAEKYINIFQAQMDLVIEQLQYYAHPDKKNMEYLSSLRRKDPNSIIRSNNKNDVNFWYWGHKTELPGRVKRDLDCFSLYYPFIKKIGLRNKFFFSSWLQLFNDKFIISYYNTSKSLNIPNRIGLESFSNTYNSGNGKWTPLYRDISGCLISSITKSVYDEKNNNIGRVGIDIDIDGLIKDAESYKIIDEKLLSCDVMDKPIKPFSFIMNKDYGIISFPIEYYNTFGFASPGVLLSQEPLKLKLGDSKHEEISGLPDIMKKTKSGYTVLDFDDKGEYVMAFAHIEANDWTLAVVVPLDYLLGAVRETKAEIKVITRDLMFALAIMAVMFFIVAVFLILVVFKEYLMTPINSLTVGIAGVIKSKFKKRLEEEGAPEIVDLSKTFNNMTSELNKYMDGLKKEIEVREKIEIELNTARKIQEALMPSTTKIFENRNFDLHAGVLPASFVAGDFYDYFFVSKNKLAILVGDVSGKGVSSAFYMTIVRSVVRDICQQESADPAVAVTKINKILFQEYKVDMFVSLVLVYYNVDTGTIQYVNAGHPDMLLVKADGKSKGIERNVGLILAFAENTEYKSVSFNLEFNETLILYSDGILEAYNDDLLFFRKHLMEFLKKSYILPVEALCDKVLNEVEKNENQKRDDDFTLLVFRRVHGGIKPTEN